VCVRACVCVCASVRVSACIHGVCLCVRVVYRFSVCVCVSNFVSRVFCAMFRYLAVCCVCACGMQIQICRRTHTIKM